MHHAGIDAREEFLSSLDALLDRRVRVGLGV
jgi:hypothetical protein